MGQGPTTKLSVLVRRYVLGTVVEWISVPNGSPLETETITGPHLGWGWAYCLFIM